jgi:DNA repair ATPase RecN
LLLSIKIFTSIVSENSERAAENKILRVQEKMQKEVDRAEKAESDALAKYAEARSNVNELSEQLMAERHRLNITATELEQKQDRVTKLLSERYLT